jgi:hypothetical protein
MNVEGLHLLVDPLQNVRFVGEDVLFGFEVFKTVINLALFRLDRRNL